MLELRRILACFAAAVLGGLAMAPAAPASISITTRSAQLQVTDEACVDSLAVCDRHLDPPISSGTGTGPLTFDHAVTQPHATASAGETRPTPTPAATTPSRLPAAPPPIW